MTDNQTTDIPVCGTCAQPEYCRGMAECHYTKSPLITHNGEIPILIFFRDGGWYPVSVLPYLDLRQQALGQSYTCQTHSLRVEVGGTQ